MSEITSDKNPEMLSEIEYKVRASLGLIEGKDESEEAVEEAAE